MKRIVKFLLFPILILSLIIAPFSPIISRDVTFAAISKNNFKYLVDDLILNYTSVNIGAIAGSDAEKNSSEFIVNYLNQNTSFEPKKSVYYDGGIQSFSFLSDYTGHYQYSQNVIYSKPAKTETNKRVIIGCHYDAPAVFDAEKGYIAYETETVNASIANVACLLSIAKLISGMDFDYNIDLVFFGAGESSCAGAKFYLNGITSEEKSNILCMINLDKVAIGSNLYFYSSEIETTFSKFISSTMTETKQNTKQLDVTHVIKTSVINDSYIGLGYFHIGMDSDSIEFMRAGINTINLFSGEYETGIVLGRCEYAGSENITYTTNDTLSHIYETLGKDEISDNLYEVYSSIESILCSENFVEVCLSSQGELSWFYKVFGNEKIVVFLMLLVFVGFVCLTMFIHYKLTVKSYYAKVEEEFVSTVINITEQVDNNGSDTEAPKVVSQIIAKDLKKDKTIKSTKKKDK